MFTDRFSKTLSMCYHLQSVLELSDNMQLWEQPSSSPLQVRRLNHSTTTDYVSHCLLCCDNFETEILLKTNYWERYFEGETCEKQHHWFYTKSQSIGFESMLPEGIWFRDKCLHHSATTTYCSENWWSHNILKSDVHNSKITLWVLTACSDWIN